MQNKRARTDLKKFSSIDTKKNSHAPPMLPTGMAANASSVIVSCGCKCTISTMKASSTVHRYSNSMGKVKAKETDKYFRGTSHCQFVVIVPFLYVY